MIFEKKKFKHRRDSIKPISWFPLNNCNCNTVVYTRKTTHSPGFVTKYWSVNIPEVSEKANPAGVPTFLLPAKSGEFQLLRYFVERSFLEFTNDRVISPPFDDPTKINPRIIGPSKNKRIKHFSLLFHPVFWEWPQVGRFGLGSSRDWSLLIIMQREFNDT